MKTRLTIFALSLIGLIVSTAASFWPTQEGPGPFRPRTLMGPIRTITEVPVAPADQAGDAVHDNELVLGVEVNGEARAYPINTLTGPQREIFNDELGGRPIAATW